MQRLSVRLGILIFLAILSTTIIQVITQESLYQRAYKQLSPNYQQHLKSVLEDDSLSHSEIINELKLIFAEFSESPAEFKRFFDFLLMVVDDVDDAFFSTALLSLLLGFFASILIALFLTRPILSIARAANEITQGNLSIRASYSKPLPSHDVTLLINNFNSMASRLEQLEHERKAMIADISHELRTPLTVIQGQLDAIQYDVVPLNKEELAKLNRHTEVLSRLIKDLRTLSLLDAGQLKLEKDTLNIVSLCQEVCEGFQEEARRKKIRLDFENHSKGIVLIEADTDRLVQIFSNLLANALRYTSEGGWVKLELESQTNKVHISVRDSGKGLTEEGLQRVFDRFYREDKSRRRVTGGSGLGLAIVKALVELHEGKISVENHQSAGAVFTVQLKNLYLL